MPTRSRESLEEAASLNVSTIQWVPPRMKVIRAAFDHYRDAYQRAQPSGQKPRIGLMREIYVAASDKEALEEAKDHWIYFWQRRGGARAYGGYGHENLTTMLDGERKKELLDIDQSIKDGSFICGSPETVARQIREIALQAGADTFLGEFAFGALEHRQVMNSLRLFTDQVMPELKKFEIDALNYPRAEA
jgi:alkanesulfonate monooxygenase SsuD/methylene tetrahydromethanopterin reductase-like flavin-dependent oxidoreductase (luciferase family)